MFYMFTMLTFVCVDALNVSFGWPNRDFPVRKYKKSTHYFVGQATRILCVLAFQEAMYFIALLRRNFDNVLSTCRYHIGRKTPIVAPLTPTLWFRTRRRRMRIPKNVFASKVSQNTKQRISVKGRMFFLHSSHKQKWHLSW